MNLVWDIIGRWKILFHKIILECLATAEKLIVAYSVMVIKKLQRYRNTNNIFLQIINRQVWVYI